jgi:5'-nucleotidase
VDTHDLAQPLDPESGAVRALVTNDDGVDSEGLQILAEAAVAAGFDVMVVAPCWDSSGASASLTAVAEDGRVVAERGTLPDGGPVLAVHGPPSFIVRAAAYGAFGPPPDIVLCGINRGMNVGRAILHSGTVGAALTAATFNRRALAISAEVGDPPNWSAAAAMTGPAIGWLVRATAGSVLNVNVPECGPNAVPEVAATRLAAAGVVQANLSDRNDGFVPVTFGDGLTDGPPGTDASALSGGMVSVSAIRPVCDDEQLDLAALVGTGSAGDGP